MQSLQHSAERSSCNIICTLQSSPPIHTLSTLTAVNREKDSSRTIPYVMRLYTTKVIILCYTTLLGFSSYYIHLPIVRYTVVSNRTSFALDATSRRHHTTVQRYKLHLTSLRVSSISRIFESHWAFRRLRSEIP